MDSSTRQYDVAISFAGIDRGLARELADALLRHGTSVFYDEYEKAHLWGKNLYDHLADLYKNRATYCVILFSEAYRESVWTQHELKSAQSRSLESDQEYILPIRLGNTVIPDTVRTIGYLSYPPETPSTIADVLQVKLGRAAIVTAPLSKETIALSSYQLPDSLRIVALGPQGAGKKLFFLYLVNALLQEGRYSPVSLPNDSLAIMSSFLVDIRKGKLPTLSRQMSSSEIMITFENNQSKKRCALEVYFPNGETISMDAAMSELREKTMKSDVVLLFIPSTELKTPKPDTLKMFPHLIPYLRDLSETSISNKINKPLGVIFTKWDLIRREVNENFKGLTSDQSMLMELLENFQPEQNHIKLNFRDPAYFYFSIAPPFLHQPPSAKAAGLSDILEWVLGRVHSDQQRRGSGFLKRFEIFIQNWRSRGSRKKA